MSSVLMTKAPTDVLDYDVDFSRWLSTADKIDNANATIAGSTATVERVEFSETVVKVWLAGGLDSEAGTVSVTITTQQTRSKEFCFRVRIKDCH